MYLLDTNVISELRKPETKRNQQVSQWFKQSHINQFFLSSTTILEIEMGILKLDRKDPIQASKIKTWFNKGVLDVFAERVLPFDTNIALACAALHIPNPRSERDAMIAATASVHDLTLVTRNIKDFKHINLKIINPWLEH